MGMNAALEARKLRPRRPSSMLLDVRAIFPVSPTKKHLFGRRKESTHPGDVCLSYLYLQHDAT